MANQLSEPFVLDFQNGQQVENILKKAQSMADIRTIGDGLSLDADGTLSGAVVDATYDTTSQNAQSGVAVAEAVSTKVDKETGKGLSSNDFTNADKEKLDTIEQLAAQIAALTNRFDTQVGNFTLRACTETEYAAIDPKDANTIYHVTEDVT